MMSRQTPVPSGSIRTVNSVLRPVPGILRLATSRMLRMMKPKIFAGVDVENMYLTRIHRDVNHVCSRPATDECCQRGLIHSQPDQKIRSEGFNPTNPCFRARSNLQCFRPDPDGNPSRYSEAGIVSNPIPREGTVIQIRFKKI